MLILVSCRGLRSRACVLRPGTPAPRILSCSLVLITDLVCVFGGVCVFEAESLMMMIDHQLVLVCSVLVFYVYVLFITITLI